MKQDTIKAEQPCKRCAAYKLLTSSLEDQLAHHRQQATAYREAVATLESERQANAILTAELAAPAPASKPESQKLLTDDEIKDMFDSIDFGRMVTADDLFFMIARAVEDRLTRCATSQVVDG